MASSHAVQLCGVARDSLWQSSYWLPRGWATDAFITLSGITAALVYDWNDDFERATKGTRRRAFQLLLVMFISNFILLVTKYMALHELDKVKHLSWWVGLITFETPYSISLVLLPTVVFLLLAPVLNQIRMRFGVMALALSALTAGIWVHHGHQSPLIQAFVHWGGMFPVVPMVGTGMLGFTLGFVWKQYRMAIPTRIAFVPTGMSVAILFLPLPIPNSIISSVLPTARVLFLMTITALVMYGTRRQDSETGMGLFGKYALLCFLGHRVLLNVTVALSRPLVASSHLYEFSMITMFTILGLLCWYRNHHPEFDRGLKLIYL